MNLEVFSSMSNNEQVVGDREKNVCQHIGMSAHESISIFYIDQVVGDRERSLWHIGMSQH